MNINDFAHYYIGQRCLNAWFPEEHPNYNPGWVLTGLDRGSHRPFKLETEDDFTWTASIKLLLRRLEDMTEAEWNEIETEVLIPDAWGMNALKDSFEKPQIQENRFGWTAVNAALIALRKRGIDVDGLIDLKLAEDIKNIKP